MFVCLYAFEDESYKVSPPFFSRMFSEPSQLCGWSVCSGVCPDCKTVWSGRDRPLVPHAKRWRGATLQHTHAYHWISNLTQIQYTRIQVLGLHDLFVNCYSSIAITQYMHSSLYLCQQRTNTLTISPRNCTMHFFQKCYRTLQLNAIIIKMKGFWG